MTKYKIFFRVFLVSIDDKDHFGSTLILYVCMYTFREITCFIVRYTQNRNKLTA
jgi:hypothetical protein